MSENKELDAIDKILDEENTDNIVLYDDEDNEYEFEQVAIIPMDESVYVILAPVAEMDGVEPDEGVVFVIEEKDDDAVLTVVTEDEIIDKVFVEYEKLLEEEGDGDLQ